MNHLSYIFITHRGGARLFAFTARDRRLFRLGEWDFPKGRLRNRDINADRPGTMRQRRGFGTSTLAKHNDPVQQERLDCAHRIAKIIERLHVQARESRFLVTADARLGGEIHKRLRPATRRDFVSFLNKDLAHVPDSEIWGHVSELVLESLEVPRNRAAMMPASSRRMRITDEEGLRQRPRLSREATELLAARSLVDHDLSMPPSKGAVGRAPGSPALSDAKAPGGRRR